MGFEASVNQSDDIVQYVGRFGEERSTIEESPTVVGDALSGPETIRRCHAGAGLIIRDPISFPWQFVDPKTRVGPYLIDLRTTTPDDMIALGPVLTKLDAGDIWIVGDHEAVLSEHGFDSTTLFRGEPDDVASTIRERSATSRWARLLRNALEPVIQTELERYAASEPAQSVGVLEIGEPTFGGWLGSFVDAPHRYLQSELGASGRNAAAIVVTNHSTAVAEPRPLLQTLQPNGLICVIFDVATLTGSAGITPASDLIERYRAETDGQILVHHVWGCRPSAGAATLGGVVCLRILEAS